MLTTIAFGLVVALSDQGWQNSSATTLVHGVSFGARWACFAVCVGMRLSHHPTSELRPRPPTP